MRLRKVKKACLGHRASLRGIGTWTTFRCIPELSGFAASLLGARWALGKVLEAMDHIVDYVEGMLGEGSSDWVSGKSLKRNVSWSHNWRHFEKRLKVTGQGPGRGKDCEHNKSSFYPKLTIFLPWAYGPSGELLSTKSWPWPCQSFFDVGASFYWSISLPEFQDLPLGSLVPSPSSMVDTRWTGQMHGSICTDEWISSLWGQIAGSWFLAPHL